MKKTAALSSLLLIWAFAAASGAAAQDKPAAFGYDIFRAPSEPIVEGSVDDGYLLSGATRSSSRSGASSA